MIEGLSKMSHTAFKSLETLKADERLNTLAILFEHWENELINDGNYTDPEKAYERNREVFTPMDCGVTGARDLAHALAALAREERSEEDQGISSSRFSDLVEPHIIQTEGIKNALTGFYKLTFRDKLDYFAELLSQLEGGELLEDINVPAEGFGVNGYQTAVRIMAFKEGLYDGKAKDQAQDLPFDLA